MNSEHRIEPSLFDLLTDVGPIIERIRSKQQINNKDLLDILKIRDNLTVFCKNFLIQFFYNSFGLLIDGININTMHKVNKFFKELSFWKQKPRKMIRILSLYTEIHRDIMGDPYTRKIQVSTRLYCSFLPQLFEAFQEEANGIIDNFEEVMAKINETLKIIQKTCQY